MPNMATLNIIGHLGQDPEMRYLPDGAAVTSFSVAVSRKSKDGDATDWFRVSAWGKLAEVCSTYLSKGALVYVSGAFSTRQYQASNGETRTSLELSARDMQMLSGKRDGEPSGVAAPDDSSIPF